MQFLNLTPTNTPRPWPETEAEMINQLLANPNTSPAFASLGISHVSTRSKRYGLKERNGVVYLVLTETACGISSSTSVRLPE